MSTSRSQPWRDGGGDNAAAPPYPSGARARRRPAIFHHSAGAVVLIEGRCLALRRRDNGQWVFPKGHLEQDEGPEEAAVREVREETGLEVRILAELGSSRYQFGRRPSHRKRVDWFVATPTGGSLVVERGFSDSALLDPGEAERVLAYAEDRELARLAFERAPGV